MSDRHEQFYNRYTGKFVSIGECPVCGHLETQSTRDGGGYEVVPLRYGCRICAEVSVRAGEVYDWVRAVVAKAVEDKR